MRHPDSNLLHHKQIMSNFRRHLDWQIFWLREVLFLSLPVLIVVLKVPTGGGYIHPEKLTALLAVLIGLTLVNVLWLVFSASFTNRTRTNNSHEMQGWNTSSPSGSENSQRRAPSRSRIHRNQGRYKDGL